MKDFLFRLKLWIGSALAFARGYGLFLIVGLVLLVFFIVGIQKACDRRAERLEDEHIKAYDVEIAERLKVFQNYINSANRDHETTMTILDAMSKMTRNINQLAENDKTITARVDEISQNEYKAARGQKNNQAQVKNGKAKTNKPLKVREIEALKTDAELYPDGK